MKKKLLALIIFFSANVFLAEADFWTQMADHPGAGKELPISFAIGNKGYVGCGTGLFDFWEFDPAANLWTQKADVPGGIRRAGIGFSINDKGYASTGEIPLNDLWEYDTTANSWTQMPNLPGPGRSFAAAFVIGNKVYLGGGQSPFMSDLWEWDQTTQIWTQKASCGNVMTHEVAFAVNGKGYWTTSCCSTAEMWEYDPVSDTWTQKGTFPGGPRSDARGFVICDKGYLCTGGEGPFYNDLWQYNASLDQWIQKASIPSAGRDDGASFSINGKGYYGLGQIGGITDSLDFWEYTPDSSCFSAPVALFSAPNHICPGTCTGFTNLSVNATSYLWTFAGATPSTSTDANPSSICYNTPGNYAVQLIVTNANTSDTLTLNNYITVYPFPAPQGIAQSGDTLFANAGAVSYQWYYEGNLIPGATDYFYVAQAGGDYNVVCTDGNGCEVEAAIFSVVASVQSIVDNGHLAIYPNPVADKCTIRNPRFVMGAAVSISIFNLIGKKILAVQSEIKNPKSEMSFDVQGLAPGIYWIELRCDKKNYYAKFLKQ